MQMKVCSFFQFIIAKKRIAHLPVVFLIVLKIWLRIAKTLKQQNWWNLNFFMPHQKIFEPLDVPKYNMYENYCAINFNFIQHWQWANTHSWFNGMIIHHVDLCTTPSCLLLFFFGWLRQGVIRRSHWSLDKLKQKNILGNHQQHVSDSVCIYVFQLKIADKLGNMMCLSIESDTNCFKTAV